MPKGNFSWNLWLCTTAGVTQHLNIKDRELVVDYSSIMSMQKLFDQSAQIHQIICEISLI